MRARGQQHGALAAIDRLVESAPVAFQKSQRTGPVAGGAAEFEHRAPGPAQRRRGSHRLLRISTRAAGIVTAARLDEQAVQAERLGVGAACHRAEGAVGAVAVAGELCRLRGNKKRKRLAGRERG